MIWVFGSLNVDLVVRLDHLPKAGETVIGPGYEIVAGGKGANQALAARRAGASVKMVGAVGKDSFAEVALRELAADGVDLSSVARVDRPTGAAFIGVDEAGENQIIVAAGANRAARATQIAERDLVEGDWLLMQMEVPHEENWAMTMRAKAAGLQTLLNLAPAAPLPVEIMAKLDWLIVNEIEIVAIADQVGIGEREPIATARAISKRGLSVVVTLGGAGAAAFTSSGAWRVGVLPIHPVDSTGAGDAFVGAFAAALDAGRTPPDALHRAAIAGGLACLTVGAQPSLPHRAAIEAQLALLARPTPL